MASVRLLSFSDWLVFALSVSILFVCLAGWLSVYLAVYLLVYIIVCWYYVVVLIDLLVQMSILLDSLIRLDRKSRLHPDRPFRTVP